MKAILLDWRVATLIILVLLSVIAIYPHFDENGNLASNLQYGLDLQQGAWIQLEMKGEVIGYTTSQPVDVFVANLTRQLGTEVVVVDENHLEIRKIFSQAELVPVVAADGGKITSFQPGVSKATADDVKLILENKINTLGTKDAKVNVLSGLNNVAQYIRVELAGVDMNQAQEIVGKQGKFEIRIVTVNNQTEHVLSGDAITSVQTPSQSPAGSNNWGVGFTLSDDGASAFQAAAVKYGATVEPSKHNLMMILDNQTVYSAPLSTDLAGTIQGILSGDSTHPRDQARTGWIRQRTLKSTSGPVHYPLMSALPGPGGSRAPMGERYKEMALLAGLFALVTVGFVIYYRYREPSIVLPMVLTNMSEIVILLGFISLIRFQMDLPTIAGLIAVLGTGIDQLVVITDEILHEGKVPSPNLYLKRLARALSIIVIAAATVLIAMLPLALMDLSTLKGFAIITILGVLVGVIVTRPAYGKIIMAILSK